jgi:ferredoxin
MPTIRFITSGRTVDFPDGDDVNLLRIAIRNECDVPYKCASGNCGTDRIYVESGASHLSPPRKRERDRLGELLDQGWRLACQTYVSGDISISWDKDQTPLNPNAVDKSLPNQVDERIKNRWLQSKDTD